LAFLYRKGFQTVSEECPDTVLATRGTVPPWLNGTLVRNGPAQYQVGTTEMNHWFDGFAKLHRFSFEPGGIKYASKFLETEALTIAKARGKIRLGEFGTSPEKSFLGRMVDVFAARLTDNTNVNVAKWNDSHFAMTETPTLTTFDIVSLETLGKFKLTDKLKGQITTAHPHYDPELGQLFNLLIEFGPESHYYLYSIANGSAERKRIVRIPVKTPAYLHSFGMSKHYIIIVESPLVVKPLELITSGKPFIQNYRWEENSPTRYLVISKENGMLLAEFEGSPCFCFHHVNAFERGDEIVVDLLAYEDATIVQSLYLEELLHDDQPIPLPKLRRIRLLPSTKQIVEEQLSDVTLELPRINYKTCNGKPYRYVFATSGSQPGNFLDSLVKLDLDNNKVSTWQEEGCYPGEPVFVGRERTTTEDDGVLLSVVLNAKESSSFLLVLEASSMNEIARATIPQMVPFGFHGQYFNN
jgi:beta,beta-carotene 9',10'-dioxygenase